MQTDCRKRSKQWLYSADTQRLFVATLE